MSAHYRPKHRAPGHARKEPVLQPAGRHADSLIVRLGNFDVDEFMRESFGGGNPYRPSGIGRHAR